LAAILRLPPRGPDHKCVFFKKSEVRPTAALPDEEEIDRRFNNGAAAVGTI
jgi:hypothetical protein